MKNSIKKGLGFGLTSGSITSLGLMIGLYSSTESLLAILGGLFVIAVADSLADGLGMHVSEESNYKKSKREIWEATFSTIFFKFIFAISFMIPFLIFNLSVAIYIGVIWGIILISASSYKIGKLRGEPYRMIFEHLGIAILVLVSSYLIGLLVRSVAGS
ncbi:MAG: hypothetical protein KKB31_02100 [Nanoarchaeota archaeon]|nr:hypothetical protein [Nanoarchaeota archaeon]